MFETTWKRMGLDEEGLRRLEDMLLLDPAMGDVMPGLHGARKIRVPASDHGKRGGGRVIYVDVLVQERIYLLLAYPKNEMTNLTADQKKILASLVRALKGEKA